MRAEVKSYSSGMSEMLYPKTVYNFKRMCFGLLLEINSKFHKEIVFLLSMAL